ncbi:MAG TPA: VWA domain-containing protein [Terriglobales bacterium]|nr:VWA domain-containing protein [Terriglobales bacterium]
MNRSACLKASACALVALLAALLAVGPALRAQDAVATIAVDVKVVTLPVTVRDKHGAIVRDLTKDDFTLQEDGRPQAIRYFSQEANLPLTLGLLVDTSRSQTSVLDAERNASRSFLEQMLVQEKDKAFLIHFDREVELLQDLTSSREKLQSALELLKTPSDRERSNHPNDSDDSHSGSGSHHGGGTQLYDAVFLASNELMKKQPGRKALIILSDGVDRGSKTYLEGAIESAQRADTVVYSIYFADTHRDEGERRGGGMGRSGGGWPGGGGGWPGGGGGYPGGGGGRGGHGGQRPSESPRTDGKKILERVSKETGGRFFEVSKKQTVGEIYTSIVEELRTQYSMGYTPDKDSAASGYHHLQLQVKRKELTVQTRDGYYADR